MWSCELLNIDNEISPLYQYCVT